MSKNNSPTEFTYQQVMHNIFNALKEFALKPSTFTDNEAVEFSYFIDFYLEGMPDVSERIKYLAGIREKTDSGKDFLSYFKVLINHPDSKISTKAIEIFNKLIKFPNSLQILMGLPNVELAEIESSAFFKAFNTQLSSKEQELDRKITEAMNSNNTKSLSELIHIKLEHLGLGNHFQPDYYIRDNKATLILIKHYNKYTQIKSGKDLTEKENQKVMLHSLITNLETYHVTQEEAGLKSSKPYSNSSNNVIKHNKDDSKENWKKSNENKNSTSYSNSKKFNDAGIDTEIQLAMQRNDTKTLSKLIFEALKNVGLSEFIKDTSYSDNPKDTINLLIDLYNMDKTKLSGSNTQKTQQKALLSNLITNLETYHAIQEEIKPISSNSYSNSVNKDDSKNNSTSFSSSSNNNSSSISTSQSSASANVERPPLNPDAFDDSVTDFFHDDNSGNNDNSGGVDLSGLAQVVYNSCTLL